jgi:hypothetical protein
LREIWTNEAILPFLASIGANWLPKCRFFANSEALKFVTCDFYPQNEILSLISCKKMLILTAQW